MNSYERFMTALERNQPDRVPLAEFIIDPKVYTALLPGARSQSDFEDHFEFDAVGCGAKFETVRTNGDGSYVDEWGVLYQPSAEVVSHPVKGPIETPEDLERYVPPDPDAPHRLGKLPEYVARYKGKKAIIFHQRAAFMWSAYLNGIDNLLVNFLAEPSFAHELMDTVLAVNLQIARNALRIGADVIVLGDDYASNIGPLFSPGIFAEFVLPRLQRMVDTVHEAGGKVVKHSDGNLWKILDPIIETGIDGLNPIEPVAGMDIGQVKRKYGHRVCLLGNIDCGHLLSFGTAAEVEEAVKQCLRQAGEGGGLIITSSNSIHSSVNPENYRAMIQAVKRWGKYPLTL